jgi:outer membrane protein assembly factor BamB
MSRQLLALFAAAGLVLGGCATVSDTFDSINPFSSAGPKMAPLPTLTVASEVSILWSAGIGKSGDYTFTPAIVDRKIFVAGQNGVVSRIEDGKVVWKVDAGQPLSAGVGANGRLVVVGTAKGEVLAFSAEDGKALWKARVSSEVLAAPVVGDDGVAVKSGDNQVFLFDAGDGGRKWAYQRSTPPLSVRAAGSPVFADRYLFVGYPGGKARLLCPRGPQNLIG